MRLLMSALATLAALGLIGLAAACGGDGNGATPTPGEGTVDIVLYFPKITDTGFDFLPAERSIAATEAQPAAVVTLLLAGPTEEEESSLGVSNPFPANVKVLSLDVAGDAATVDFSEELLEYGGGSANVIAISESITRTVQELTGASSVVILVEGQPDQLQP